MHKIDCIVQCFSVMLIWVIISLKNESQDFLFLVTARYHIAIVSYDAKKRDVITRGYGDVKVSQQAQ